ncbi:MAG: hypothetical protein JWO48_3367 [Bryobacterales bacterium]|nr:hypothetical protein [Bryobacterales bacterium]
MFRRHISQQLVAYCDGQLTTEETQRADMHLGACPRCRAELDQIRFVAAIVEDLPIVQAPDSIRRSIERALDGHLDSDAAPTRSREKARIFPIRVWRFGAAFVIAFFALGAAYWYFMRQPKPQWEVMRLEGTPALGVNRIDGTSRFSVGEWLQTDQFSRAKIKVGDIGLVEVEPNTRLRLVAARRAEHRLALIRGEISATITAPPRLFFVDTASSIAVDLGCAYKMQVDDTGFGLLRVTAGWVSLEWGGRESLVPAGANCRTRPKIGPGTPFFDDAPERLERALARFDFESAGSSAIDAVLAESRPRDTLTLWHLLMRVDASQRPRIYDRMITLAPLPNGVTREKALKLDPETLKRWKEELAWTW